jgi:hypothetical protein
MAMHRNAELSFRTDRPGLVSLNIYRLDGTLVRRLIQAQKFPAGPHMIAWDGRTDDGTVVEPGEFSWRGLFHEGIGLKLRGWAANGGATPWPTADGKGDWGGDVGVPSAVAADAQQVYLGWSLAERGKAVLACDLEGRVQWAHRRAEGASGCKALAVDDGVIYVLGGLAGVDAEGGAVYKLSARDGQVLPWPNGKTDLKIASFWPPEARTKPAKADGMAVRHNRIYLTFTSSEFMTILDAKTGAYLQTVVGAPPGLIDVAPTKTDLPDAPGKMVDADFAVISLGGGVLGKVLFAHDPLWVIMSELTPIDRDVRISALSVIGDGAKFHQHTAFVGLEAPFHQVQARPLLDMEGFTWFAGKPGGRPLLGPWQPEALRAIRGLALDAAGKLWVAESDGFPKRFSVWETTGPQGKLVREFFGPTRSSEAAAINPLDPDLMFAQGCEWRIDRTTGRARCLGVIIREPIDTARFGVGENGRAYLVAGMASGSLRIFERMGEGDYRLRTQVHPANESGEPVPENAAVQTIFWADENDDGMPQAEERQSFPAVWQFQARATLQDLALTANSSSASAQMFPVHGWTACGAPRYDLSAGKSIGDGQLSADGRLVLLSNKSAQAAGVVCRVVGDKQPRWGLSWDVAAEPGVIAGVAKLAEPIGNLWLLSRENTPWSLLTEDGFEIARFFSENTTNSSWPKVAKPGADMTRMPAGKNAGGLTQAADGQLYLHAGESAAWNLEVTGLDKVRAISGGKVRVLAPR